MREKVDAEALQKFMEAIGRSGEMIDRSLIEPAQLLKLFAQIEDQIYKYPAIDAKSFRKAVEAFIQSLAKS